MQAVDYDIPIADRIEGLLQPYENGCFVGQEAADARFLAGAKAGRLHHAWLLCGPVGVGKASFAFRIARAFTELQDGQPLPHKQTLNESSNADNPVFRRIASGGHPNILHLRVPLDEKTKKFKTQLTVDEVRRSVGFFGSTAGEAGWRVAIVDSADQMTISAANALLKILEEPPEKTLFFLLSSQPGRLLPTIRSRCQQLDFQPLNYADMTTALTAASSDDALNYDSLQNYSAHLGGSVRRAYQFLANDMASLVDECHALLASQPNYNMATLHSFADHVAARGGDEKYNFFVDLMEGYVSNKVRAGGAPDVLVSLAKVWEKMRERIDLESRMNLDRKQTVLALFHDVCEAS
ncbi:MAG: DNA polymerase III subunit delta' [Hyphomicrobiales bacterium]